MTALEARRDSYRKMQAALQREIERAAAEPTKLRLSEVSLACGRFQAAALDYADAVEEALDRQLERGCPTRDDDPVRRHGVGGPGVYLRGQHD